jgi:hypothetical protein
MKLETGTIVIVNTHDLMNRGVRVPAIIRYELCPGIYEVNALTAAGENAASYENIKWWTVTEHEIECVLGKAIVERPDAIPLGTTTITRIRG